MAQFPSEKKVGKNLGSWSVFPYFQPLMTSYHPKKIFADNIFFGFLRKFPFILYPERPNPPNFVLVSFSSISTLNDVIGVGKFFFRMAFFRIPFSLVTSGQNYPFWPLRSTVCECVFIFEYYYP